MNRALLRAPWMLTLARVFADAGAPLYAVGGIVRNALMDLPASDVDVCGPTHPEAVIRLCADTPVRAEERAAHFGTVELHLTDADGRHMAEYTTFREDSYRCGHQPVTVRFASTAEVDALRRDFSVNAMYCPLLPEVGAEPPVLDPTGGLSHLREGVLHTVTPDPDQVLKDDGLRILRAARFQAELGLTPTEALRSAARRFSPLLRDIAPERRRAELEKILVSDTRYPALKRSVHPVTAGLSTLAEVNAWPYLFGPLGRDAAALAAQTYYRPPDGLAPASGRLALLFCQDVPDALANQMRLLRFSQREIADAHRALSAFVHIARGNATRMEAVRLGLPAVTHAAAALRALGQAGAPQRGALALAEALEATLSKGGLPLSLRELALTGNDLLPLCQEWQIPVRRIGEVLDALWQSVVEEKLPNVKTSLLAMAREMLTPDGASAQVPEAPQG